MLSLRYREPPDDSAAGGAMEETLSCRGCTCVTGMFIWPQIDDQRQRSLVTAGAQIQTTNTSEAVYVLAAVSAWPGVATRRFRGPSRSVTGVLAHRAAGSAPNAEYLLFPAALSVLGHEYKLSNSVREPPSWLKLAQTRFRVLRG